ncbi:TPA: GrxB family glutaredoxin [Pasteurella multocida]|uniref:GrxB family glutaredoxin n=1 Tax=Pasteurella multocida TaxID=747 RepID=UPI000233F88D|nr:GrxB family glutaredoxin [Pasteurella multocida]AWW59461.1 glutaredoxin, GrxB family [Pasteurellaceae bacterium 12591]AET15497.1 glutaredoxin GrxB protein [Pasteurella multocida 36950]AHE63981.1 glutaredoxin GrxB protein [Pasteurella multocida subsp. multocida str. HB03]AIN48672.1 glutaredoxin, GrxB family [Pasteurella multocida]ANJ89752.1 glutaredoxin GrxB protein [Pasteurella multocida subsp. multocida HB01]
MELYVYDHCPYCVRAMMIFGLKNIPFKKHVLLNDDEETPIRLVGKKMVPILVKEDGTAMPESLDIVKYIDAHYGEAILQTAVRPEIEALLAEITSYSNYLLMPRFVKLDLAEFATQSAIDYFTKKKTDYVGDFTQHFNNTPTYLARLTQDLEKLSALVMGETSLNQHLSFEDILVFPLLRNLTCVKGLRFPARLEKYIKRLSELSKVELYTSQAI